MKPYYWLLLLLPFTGVAAPLPSYCPKTLDLVFYGDWHPYMFAAPHTQTGYQGSDYELLQNVIADMGCKMDVLAIPEKRAHRSLAMGHELVMTAATYTEQRARYAYFSNPYRQETMSVFYLDDKQPPKTLAARLTSANTIVINAAAWYGETIESYRAGPHKDKFQHVPGMIKRIEMLQRDRAQLMVEDHIAGCNYIHRHAPELIPRLKSIQVHSTEVSFMFSKQVVSDEFTYRFNKSLADQLANGTYERLIAKYQPQGC